MAGSDEKWCSGGANASLLCVEWISSCKLQSEDGTAIQEVYESFTISLFHCLAVSRHGFYQFDACCEWDRVAGFCENSGRRENSKLFVYYYIRTVSITGLLERQ